MICCKIVVNVAPLVIKKWNDFFYPGFTRGEIIVYSRNTINVYSLLSHEWCVLLIKFMVGPTIHVRGESTHL